MIRHDKLIGYHSREKRMFLEVSQNRHEISEGKGDEIVDFSGPKDVLREDYRLVLRNRIPERFSENSCEEIAGIRNGNRSSGNEYNLCFPGNIPHGQMEITPITCTTIEAQSPSQEDRHEITLIHAPAGSEIKNPEPGRFRAENKKKSCNQVNMPDMPPDPGLVMEIPDALLECFTQSMGTVNGIAGVRNDGTLELSAQLESSLPTGSGGAVNHDDLQTEPFFDAILWACHCEASRQAGEPVRFEYFNAEKDRYYEITVMFFRLTDTRTPCCAWTVRDITIQRRTEASLGLTTKKLNLVNGIAFHEIQNKVTAIRGYVELSKQADPDGTIGTYIKAEETALGQIHEILHYCAEYQEIGSGPRRWFNVKETIRAVVSLMEIEGFHPEMNISRLEVLADPLLVKVFACLIRYSVNTAYGTPRIRIHYDKIPEGLCLIYEDSGQGLPHRDNRNPFVEDLIKSEDFCMKFVHDILDFSGMQIEAVGDPGQGLRMIIRIPEGKFRFSSGVR